MRLLRQASRIMAMQEKALGLYDPGGASFYLLSSFERAFAKKRSEFIMQRLCMPFPISSPLAAIGADGEREDAPVYFRKLALGAHVHPDGRGGDAQRSAGCRLCRSPRRDRAALMHTRPFPSTRAWRASRTRGASAPDGLGSICLVTSTSSTPVIPICSSIMNTPLQ